MKNINTKTGTFINMGYTYEYEEITFRRKDFNKVVVIANEWMAKKYGDTFIGFERSDMYENCGWSYIARMKKPLDDETYISQLCFIGSTGKQWQALLRHEKEIKYSVGC